MRRLITILFLLITISGFGQYEKILNGKNVNPYNLILKNKFIWEGKEVVRDSLVYAEIQTGAIRFRYFDGSWTDYYQLNEDLSGIRDTLVWMADSITSYDSRLQVLEGFTETDPVFSAWDKDYYSLLNQPILMENAHEGDPLFKDWNKTTGINIWSKQVMDWDEKLDTFALETDITGGVLDADFTSLAINGIDLGIILNDTANTVRSEIPTYLTDLDATGFTITESQISDFGTYDNYNRWTFYVDGSYADYITSNETLGIVGGTDISLSYNGANLTINSTAASTGTYDWWQVLVDNIGKNTVNSGDYLNFKAGTGISLSYTAQTGGADLTINATGGGTGTVTSVSAGNGMNFTTITSSGTVTLGTPSTLTASTTNSVSSTSHTHAISGFLPLTGGTLTGALSGTSGSFSSTLTATNFILSSDRRLKKNIIQLDSLEWVDKIDFKSFMFKSDITKRERYGVIAQQLLKINPNLVYKDNEGYYSVAYIDLLIAKTAQQDKRIENLENTVEQLIKRLEALEDEK